MSKLHYKLYLVFVSRSSQAHEDKVSSVLKKVV